MVLLLNEGCYMGRTKVIIMGAAGRDWSSVK